MSKYALWLPKSSVRALLALGSLAAGIGIFLYTNSTPEWLIAVVASSTAYYFAKNNNVECK